MGGGRGAALQRDPTGGLPTQPRGSCDVQELRGTAGLASPALPSAGRDSAALRVGFPSCNSEQKRPCCLWVRFSYKVPDGCVHTHPDGSGRGPGSPSPASGCRWPGRPKAFLHQRHDRMGLGLSGNGAAAPARDGLLSAGPRPVGLGDRLQLTPAEPRLAHTGLVSHKESQVQSQVPFCAALRLLLEHRLPQLSVSSLGDRD